MAIAIAATIGTVCLTSLPNDFVVRSVAQGARITIVPILSLFPFCPGHPFSPGHRIVRHDRRHLRDPRLYHAHHAHHIKRNGHY